MNFPANLKYTETHEWIKVENDTATIGITDYAVSKLGDIVFLDLPKEGVNVKKGGPFCSIESVKAVFDINSPVNGQITEANKPLADNLELFKEDSYSKGWIIKIKIANKSELDSLMDAKKYEEYVSKEEHH